MPHPYRTAHPPPVVRSLADRVRCWIGNHDWVVVRADPITVAALGSLHPHAGCVLLCRRCAVQRDYQTEKTNP